MKKEIEKQGTINSVITAVETRENLTSLISYLHSFLCHNYGQ